MKKIQEIFAMLLIGSMLITGCGKIKLPTDNDTSVSSEESNVENIEEKSKKENALNPTTPSPTAGTITLEQGYNDSDREISILGLKEYKKLKSEQYKDVAKKGKKFLVLFLEVRNRTDEKIYFNVNYLSAKVDGKKIENTILFNEPEGYPTIFSNIEADSYYGGFIVWEVPENWQKLEMTYEGWRDSDGLTLNSTLTKKNLKKPIQYSTVTYG